MCSIYNIALTVAAFSCSTKAPIQHSEVSPLAYSGKYEFSSHQGHRAQRARPGLIGTLISQVFFWAKVSMPTPCVLPYSYGVEDSREL